MPARWSASFKIQTGGFPTPKAQESCREILLRSRAGQHLCGIMMALALQHKELRNEDGEPRSKEMLAKHKESLPLVSVSSTKKILPAYQS